MDRLSPEMLHMLCTYLSINDICSLRLVSRTFAQFGECHLVPDLRFFLHSEELRRLRGIASHRSLAKHVKTLTYSCDLLDAQDRQHLVSFAWSYAATHCAGRVRDLYDGIQLKKFVMDLFRAYEADVQAQEDIIRKAADVLCLKEVLPSFTNVQRIAIHANLMLADSLKDPAQSQPATPSIPTLSNGKGRKLAIEQLGGHFMDHLHPLGCRQMESVLAGLTAAHGETLQSFYAGSLSWRFFDRDATEVVRLMKPLQKIRHLELVIEAAIDPHLSLRDSVAQCRRVLGQRRGHPLREALKLMHSLTSLKIKFAHSGSGNMDSPLFAADLADVLEPGHHWRHLRELRVQGIDTNRHLLTDVIMRHSDKLEVLSLEDVGLRDTSWHRILPDIRHNAYLRDFSISGMLLGQPEDNMDQWTGSSTHEERYECWYLPKENDRHAEYSLVALKQSVIDYCRLGGAQCPGECPLPVASATMPMPAIPTTYPSEPLPPMHWVGKAIRV